MIFFIWVVGRKRERKAPIQWFPTTAGVGQGWCQDLGAHSRFFTWIAGTQLLKPSPLPSKTFINRKLESGAGAGDISQIQMYNEGLLVTGILSTRTMTYFNKVCLYNILPALVPYLWWWWLFLSSWYKQDIVHMVVFSLVFRKKGKSEHSSFTYFSNVFSSK